MNIAHYLMNKDNKAMKFVQVIKYKNGKYFFLKDYAENETGRLDLFFPDLYLFAKKASHEVKESGLQLSFNDFR